MTAKLVVVAGQNAGAEYHLMTDRLVIGRTDQADVVVYDKAVSRRHIEVYRDGTGYSVRDLNSGNGTFLNGSRIREAELINGDRIEIGSHALQFHEAVPSRNPKDRQVVYRIDREASQPAPAPAVAPPPAAAEADKPRQMQVKVPVPAARPARAAKREKKRKASPILIAIVFLFSFAFLGLAGFIGYRLYQKHSVSEPTPQEQAAQLIERGESAMREMAFDEARDHFSAALQADPTNEVAAARLDLTSTEARFGELMAEADELISQGAYVQAVMNLRTVVLESQFLSTTAAGELSELFEALIIEGRAALDRGELAVAEAFTDVVLNADSEHRGAQTLRDEIQLVRSQQEAALAAAAPEASTEENDQADEERSSSRRRSSRRSSSGSSSSRSSSSDDDDEEEERSERSSSRSSSSGGDLDRGWRYYRDGDFERAASHFEEIGGGSGSNASEAADYADRMRSFADAYQSGLEAYNDNAYAVAVQDLRRAYSLDRRLQEAYRDSISEMLADSYYHLAQADYDEGDYRGAGENARIALRYDSRHSDTTTLVRRLEERANELFIEAVSYRESNPARARQLCRDIENMLPESSDLRRRAEALRSEL